MNRRSIFTLCLMITALLLMPAYALAGKLVASGLLDQGMYVLDDEGTVWAWSTENNNPGSPAALGLGNYEAELGSKVSAPTAVITGITDLMTFDEDETVYALDADGKLWYWGCFRAYSVHYGTMIGERADRHVESTDGEIVTAYDDNPALFMTDVESIYRGYEMYYAILRDHSLVAWGAPKNRLGVMAPLEPTIIAHDVISVCETSGYTYILKQDGTLWCWALGLDGSEYQHLGRPRQLMDSVVRVGSIGYGNIAAMKTDGSLWVWRSITYASDNGEPPHDKVTIIGFESPSHPERVMQLCEQVKDLPVYFPSAECILVTMPDGSVYRYQDLDEHSTGYSYSLIPDLHDVIFCYADQIYTGNSWFVLTADHTIYINANYAEEMLWGEPEAKPWLSGVDCFTASVMGDIYYARKSDGSLWSWRLENNKPTDPIQLIFNQIVKPMDALGTSGTPYWTTLGDVSSLFESDGFMASPEPTSTPEPGAFFHAVNGNVLIGNNSRYVIGNIISTDVDVNQDGISDSIFIDYYGDQAYLYIQFIPSSETEPEGHMALGYRDRYLYLFPYKPYRSNLALYYSDDYVDVTKGYIPVQLSLLTGDNSVPYACLVNEIYGANGWPEQYLLFYRQDGASYELTPIDLDVSPYLLSEYNGIWLRQYVGGLSAEYMPDLGRWCFVISQVAGEYTSELSVRLKTCLIIDDDGLKLVARYWDDVLVEGPYQGAAQPMQGSDSTDIWADNDSPGSLVAQSIRIDAESNGPLAPLVDYIFRASVVDENGVTLSPAWQEGIIWELDEDSRGQLEAWESDDFLPIWLDAPAGATGLIRYIPSSTRQKATLIAKHEALGIEATITVEVSPYVFSFNQAMQMASIVGYNGQDTSLTLPQTIDFHGVAYDVTAINESAFANLPLTRIILPEGYQTIAASAFEGCNQLTFVSLPASLRNIGNGVFHDCASLMDFEVSAESRIFYVDEESGALCAALTENDHPSVTDWPRSMMICLPAGREVTACVLPYEIEQIADDAFSGNVLLSDVTIANARTSVANVRFDGISGLRLLVYQGSVAEIDAQSRNLNYARIFDWSSDRFTFLNSADDFLADFDRPMTISEDWEVIRRWAKNENPETEYQQELRAREQYRVHPNYLDQLLTGMSPPVTLLIYQAAAAKWMGSCAGMTAISEIYRHDRLYNDSGFIENLSREFAPTLTEFTNPASDANVKSFVNYYYLMANKYPNYFHTTARDHLHAVSGEYVSVSGFREILTEVVQELQRGIPVRVTILKFAASTSSHSVLLLGIIDVIDGVAHVGVYDPNESTMSTCEISLKQATFSYGEYTLLYRATSENELNLRDYVTNETVPDLATWYSQDCVALSYSNPDEQALHEMEEDIRRFEARLLPNGSFLFIPDSDGATHSGGMYLMTDGLPDQTELFVPSGFSVGVASATFPFIVSAEGDTTVHASLDNRIVEVSSEVSGGMRIALAPPENSVMTEHIIEMIASNATRLEARWDEQGLFVASDNEDPLLVYRLGADGGFTEHVQVSTEGIWLCGNDGSTSDGVPKWAVIGLFGGGGILLIIGSFIIIKRRQPIQAENMDDQTGQTPIYTGTKASNSINKPHTTVATPKLPSRQKHVDMVTPDLDDMPTYIQKWDNRRASRSGMRPPEL